MDHSEGINNLCKGMIELEQEAVVSGIEKILEAGADPLDVIEKGLIPGLI